MNVYKVVKALGNHKTPEWNALVSKNLGTNAHPNRIHGFLLAREALLQGFAEFGIKISVQDLILGEYCRILAYPDFTISLSHSKAAGAALISKTSEHLSVGIDIEDENRDVKDNILERITHPKDMSLRKIELWCLKEAAFKALMNSQNFPVPIEFSSIQILDKSWSHSSSGLEGEWELEIKDGLVVARAFLKNQETSRPERDQ